MKNLKLFALIALALTLGLTGCKKDNKDNSSQLFNTYWEAHGSKSGTQIFYCISFGDDKSCEMQETHVTTPKGQELVTEDTKVYIKTGTFSLIGNNITILFSKVEEPLYLLGKSDISEISPTSEIGIDGTYSDGKLTLTIYGQDLAFTKATKPEK